jgi:hypothetical protein
MWTLSETATEMTLLKLTSESLISGGSSASSRCTCIRSFLANSHALTDIDLSPRELEESDEDFVNAMQSLIIAGFEDTNVSFSTHALTS